MNRKGGFGKKELMAVFLLLIIIFVIIFIIIASSFGKQNIKKFNSIINTFNINANILRGENINFEGREIYLVDVYNLKRIEMFKNPLEDGFCDKYESFTTPTNPIRITLKCGSYLIDDEKINGKSFKIFKVSPWKKVEGNEEKSRAANTVKGKLYNIVSDGKEVLDKYYPKREAFEKFSKKVKRKVYNENQLIGNENLVSKDYFRTQEFFQEISAD